MDITIAGYNIEDLKKQQDAIRKEATAFISNSIAQAQDIAHQIVGIVDAYERDEDNEIVGEVDVEGITKLAAQATELLKAIETVATAAGVEYYLPNRGENCWDDGDEVITRILEDVSEELDIRELNQLVGTAEDMEYQTNRWNASSC